MTGWVRVSRAIFEHDVFTHEPMSEREAWLWLVAKAAWKDTYHRAGSTVCDVPRGSLMTTLRAMQQAWQWASDKRVRTFLDKLERHGMIDRFSAKKPRPCLAQTSPKMDANKTLISICNYDKFQIDGRKVDAVGTQDGRKADALKEEDNKITKDTSSLRSDETRPCAPSGEPDLIAQGVSADLLRDWKRVRAAKKAGPITATVAAGLLREAAKADLSPAAAVRTCVERGWQSLRADWLARDGPTTQRTTFGQLAIEAATRLQGQGR